MQILCSNFRLEVRDTYYKGATNTVRKLYERSGLVVRPLHRRRPPPDTAFRSVRQIGNLNVSSTGAGSRGDFAIDITNPEPNAPTNPFGTSSIVGNIQKLEIMTPTWGIYLTIRMSGNCKMADGVAILGNGYSSSSGRAVLYLLVSQLVRLLGSK